MTIKNPFGTLITEKQYQQLITAGYRGEVPIVKLFTGPLTWLVTGIEDGILYGWADLSMDCVEWGSLTSIEELPTIKVGPFYLEQDKHFTHKPGTKYGSLETLTGI